MPGDWQSLVEPEVRYFLDYWESKRPAGGGLPSRPRVDPLEIPSLLSGTFLVDVLLSGAGMRFRFRLMGTDLSDIYGADLTGQFVDAVFESPWLESVIDSYSNAVLTCSPDLLQGPVALNNRDHIRVLSAVAPLSTDGQIVEMLLGYMKLWPDQPVS